MNSQQQLGVPLRVIVLVALAALASAGGCLSAPEHCHGCLAALADGGFGAMPDAISRDEGPAGSGGIGILGSGGIGGLGSGGAAGIGGRGAGGVMGTGGAGTGGGLATGGSGSGGRGTGGSTTGGSGTGGAVGTGGRATGGASTGGAGGLGAAGGLGGIAGDPDLVIWYKFDDSAGMTTAADSAMWGGTARPGALMTIGTGATASFSTTRQVGSHALSLMPSATVPAVNGAFVTIPALHTLAPVAMTVSVWVNLRANTATENWERIFDFGSGKAGLGNMYLTARAADAPGTPVRFAIINTGHVTGVEQRIDGASALSANAWHHIVVVLGTGPTFTGRLYIDGVSVGMNAAMTLHATDLGATTSNWLGRSQFSAADGTNPCFNGLLDDFRVYSRALTGAEILTLFALR